MSLAITIATSRISVSQNDEFVIRRSHTCTRNTTIAVRGGGRRAPQRQRLTLKKLKSSATKEVMKKSVTK